MGMRFVVLVVVGRSGCVVVGVVPGTAVGPRAGGHVGPRRLRRWLGLSQSAWWSLRVLIGLVGGRLGRSRPTVTRR